MIYHSLVSQSRYFLKLSLAYPCYLLAFCLSKYYKVNFYFQNPYSRNEMIPGSQGRAEGWAKWIGPPNFPENVWLDNLKLTVV